MYKSLVAGVLLLSLVGCGLADVGAAGAAAAASKADEIKEGKKIEDRVQQQVEADYRRAAEQRKAAEAASE